MQNVNKEKYDVGKSKENSIDQCSIMKLKKKYLPFKTICNLGYLRILKK